MNILKLRIFKHVLFLGYIFIYTQQTQIRNGKYKSKKLNRLQNSSGLSSNWIQIHNIFPIWQLQFRMIECSLLGMQEMLLVFVAKHDLLERMQWLSLATWLFHKQFLYTTSGNEDLWANRTILLGFLIRVQLKQNILVSVLMLQAPRQELAEDEQIHHQGCTIPPYAAREILVTVHEQLMPPKWLTIVEKIKNSHNFIGYECYCLVL